MELADYTCFGGRQNEAAALRNVLAYHGVTAPHTGQSFGEAMLFGIGGGIGLGYFVYQMPGYAALFIATRITTRETGRPGFVGSICERLGIEADLQTSSSAAAAEKKLERALEGGMPLIAWVDPRLLPYQATPGGYHTLVIYGLDEVRRGVFVADRADVPLVISRDELAAARQSGEVGKFQSLLVRRGQQVSPDRLRSAVLKGVEACRLQMLEGFGPPNFKNNFGLKALEKWAALLVDKKDRRGWPNLFPPGPALFDALLTAHGHIENRGDGGPAFRPFYAEFLDEAAALLEMPALSDAAELFRRSGGLWAELGAELLPTGIPAFAEARELAARARALSESGGMAARPGLELIQGRLESIGAQMAASFPLGAGEISDLLARLRECVLAVHAAESEAVAALPRIGAAGVS